MAKSIVIVAVLSYLIIAGMESILTVKAAANTIATHNAAIVMAIAQ